jgi:hypothetical protein
MRDSHSDSAIEQQEQDSWMRELSRVYAYLEPRISPDDRPIVLRAFGLPEPIQPVDYPQMPLGWNGDEDGQ